MSLSAGMILRLVVYALAVFVLLQIITIAWLQLIVERRRRRRPSAGFPYLHLGEVMVGENALRIYSRGRELYDAMLAAIEYARESVYLESFIFNGDSVGEEFKAHLIRKAEQGVAVYVMLDGFGTFLQPRRFKRFPPEVHARYFWSIRRPWHLLDPRRYALDHRKLLVVDGHIAFIGGYNIGRIYATDWRDTHLRVRGPAAADLAQSFADFWNRTGPLREKIDRHYPRHFDPLLSFWGTDALRMTFPIRDMYIKAIDRAERQILLTNAYFIPDAMLLGALKAAAARGVDVQALVPLASNHILADWASRGYYTECLRAGMRIFGYKGAMIHAKTCTIDGQWSTIGTANLDRLSSVGNFEINAEMYSDIIARQMQDLFACDKTNAREITLRLWMNRPWYVELSERLLAPLRIFL